MSSASPLSKVVIIIPTYNEVGNVKAVTQALHKVFKELKSYSCQILFVDDNSPDGTSKIVFSLASQYSFVHLLLNKRKGGLGHAYKKGMLYALDRMKADIIFEFDADLSHDPTKIPAMLVKLEQGADLVLGSRYIPGGSIPEHWGFHRKFLSVGGNLFIQFIMLNRAIRDWTTGYRAIKRQVVETIVPELRGQRFSGYTWQIGFLIKTIQRGYKVAEVPLNFHDRTIGKSKLGPEYIINNLLFIMRLRMRDLFNNRIFKFVMVGGLGSLIQFTFLYLYRMIIPVFQLAFFLSIETAIVSNFIWSNLWTFADRKLKPAQIPGKFLQFNLASAGSILIQQAVAFLGENFIGLFPLFTVPLIGLGVDTGVMFAVVGILIGMFWNFFAYSRIVWRKK